MASDIGLGIYPRTPSGPYLEVSREEVRNHDRYLYFAKLAQSMGKELRVIDRAEAKKPLSAITLSYEDARDHAKWQAAVEQARKHKVELWVEDPPVKEPADTTL